MDLICYLEDIIFGAGLARGALQSVHALHPAAVWLAFPPHQVCVRVRGGADIHRPRTLVDLATQMYSFPAATVDRILSGLTAHTTGGLSVGFLSLARTKGLSASTWVATRVSTRVRTREMDRVIASLALAAGRSRRERKASWAGHWCGHS